MNKRGSWDVRHPFSLAKEIVQVLTGPHSAHKSQPQVRLSRNLVLSSAGCWASGKAHNGGNLVDGATRPYSDIGSHLGSISKEAHSTLWPYSDIGCHLGSVNPEAHSTLWPYYDTGGHLGSLSTEAHTTLRSL